VSKKKFFEKIITEIKTLQVIREISRKCFSFSVFENIKPHETIIFVGSTTF